MFARYITFPALAALLASTAHAQCDRAAVLDFPAPDDANFSFQIDVAVNTGANLDNEAIACATDLCTLGGFQESAGVNRGEATANNGGNDVQFTGFCQNPV